MIILNADQADAVRGPTAPGYALAPVPLADGATFVLNETVLFDPAHECRWAMLASLPTRTVDPSEYVQEDA